VTLHGASNIAAVVVEPVSGSAGVLPPPVGYLEKIRSICDKHGILLVFDEVITGFGRISGSPFATSHFNVTPNLVALAKGLTGAVVPAGAVVAQENIYDAVVGQHAGGGSIEFFHG
jgi:beta-alanine--pyruvate transaminase